MTDIIRTPHGGAIDVPSSAMLDDERHPGFFIIRQPFPKPEAISILDRLGNTTPLVFPSQDWEAIKNAIDKLMETTI